jgi:plastocyanin
LIDSFFEKTMSPLKPLITVSLAALLVLSARVNGQTASSPGPHMIVVKLVETGKAMPYAFEPAIAVAQRGDTLRFMEGAGVMHNVHFTKQAPGAKLGRAATGPYLMTKGQTYDLVVDGRFTEGTYEYVCQPHEAIGMKGTLVVKSRGVGAGDR